jgi:GT2 family glycosyltransferase
VTYRSAATIGACLTSLRGAFAGEMDIVVVDNASDDDSAGVAARADAKAIVMSRPTNDGYAVGNNAGVAALAPDTEFVVFANPDTVWPAGAIDELVETFDGSVGLVSPALVGDDGAAQAIVEDDLTLRRTLLGMTRLSEPIRPRPPAMTDAVVDVDWLHTAAAVVPMTIVGAIGGFDERFYLFGEDADLCRQIRALGKRVVIAQGVRVAHVGGASFAASRAPDDIAALRTRALAIYLEKYSGKLARRVFGAFGTVVYGLGRHRGQARESWRALTR